MRTSGNIIWYPKKKLLRRVENLPVAALQSALKENHRYDYYLLLTMKYLTPKRLFHPCKTCQTGRYSIYERNRKCVLQPGNINTNSREHSVIQTESDHIVREPNIFLFVTNVTNPVRREA